jgi:hypothetical protein
MKENRGGARIGAGRKQKYGEATTNLTVRIPVSKKQEVLELVRRYLKENETKRDGIKYDPMYGC